MAADAAPGFPAFSSTMDVAVEADAPLAVGEFFTQLLQARRDGALPADVQGVFSAGAVRILELKAAHRQLCESTDALREAAGEAKSQLDQSSLQLQNLLYERQHYEKEIASCRGWQSAYRDEQIALVPLEEFAAHPVAVAGQLAEEGDPHKLMLNRLSHEVAYRQEYVQQLDGIKAQRDVLAASVAQKRSTVTGMEAEIGKLLAAARAVEQQYAPKPVAGAAAGAAGEEAQQQQQQGATAVAEQQQQEAADQQQQVGDVAMQEA